MSAVSTLRLEEKPLELDGKVYTLRCNMCVLEDLQNAHDGNFSAVMNLPVFEGAAEVLAAMLNDYAEDMGWEERWTPRAIKKRFSYAYLLDLDILGIFTRAVIPASPAQTAPAAAAGAAADAPDGDTGN